MDVAAVVDETEDHPDALCTNDSGTVIVLV
jgi:hypothetical protein